MVELSLPPIKADVQREASGIKIFDRLRQRYVALTPEEWVRQHFVAYLIERKGYPQSLVANEIGLTLNGTSRRCDTVVFDRCGKPSAIVEYKAPTVAITQKVFDQIVRYNMVLKARVLMVSNGLIHYCCRIDYRNRRVVFLSDVPDFAELIAIAD